MLMVATLKAAPINKKYEREKSLAEKLFRDIGVCPDGFRDPHANGASESGVDVIAVAGRSEIGIQVTELDTGAQPGHARREEKQTQKEYAAQGHATYGAWGQNDIGTIVAAIRRAVDRKAGIAARHDLSDHAETWLLIAAGVPEMGSVVSSFVMTQWIEADALTAASAAILRGSKFHRAFLHPIVSLEPVIYRWDRSGLVWTKESKAVLR
jgi:hypothetical protein